MDKRKGEYLGLCNLSSCTTGLPANWYNHGSLAYYCAHCATRLSNDPVNHRSAMESFGHRLCTEGPHKDDINVFLVEEDPGIAAEMAAELAHEQIGKSSRGVVIVDNTKVSSVFDPTVPEPLPYVTRYRGNIIVETDDYEKQFYSGVKKHRLGGNNRKVKKRKKAKNGRR